MAEQIPETDTEYLQGELFNKTPYIVGYVDMSEWPRDVQKRLRLSQLSLPGMSEEWAEAQIFAQAFRSYRGDTIAGDWTRCDIMPQHAVMMHYDTTEQPPKPLGFIEFAQYSSGNFSSGAWVWVPDAHNFEPSLIMAGVGSPFEARQGLLDVVHDAAQYRLHIDYATPKDDPDSMYGDDVAENMHLYALICPAVVLDKSQPTLFET